MYPSIKTLTEAFGHDKAVKIRAIMDGPHYVWEDGQVQLPYNGQSRIDRIDLVLGTFGVECIPHGHNQKSPTIYYCNTGDTYGVTVLRVNGQFRVGCWGDIVERGNYD
jgi:hypothetical protein